VPVQAVQEAMRLLVACSRSTDLEMSDEGESNARIAETGDEDLEETHWNKAEAVRTDDSAVSHARRDASFDSACNAVKCRWQRSVKIREGQVEPRKDRNDWRTHDDTIGAPALWKRSLRALPNSSVWKYGWSKPDAYSFEDAGMEALEAMKPGYEQENEPQGQEVLRRQRQRSHLRKAQEGEHKRIDGTYRIGQPKDEATAQHTLSLFQVKLVPGRLAEASLDTLRFAAAVDCAFRAAEADDAVLHHAPEVRDEVPSASGGLSGSRGPAVDMRTAQGQGSGDADSKGASADPLWMHAERLGRARDASSNDFVTEYLDGPGCMHSLDGVG